MDYGKNDEGKSITRDKLWAISAMYIIGKEGQVEAYMSGMALKALIKSGVSWMELVEKLIPEWSLLDDRRNDEIFP